ncbi:MAG: phospho-N-acetylmuramoyl-pentapeptide-transferase, partial [Clostridia bacterium]|nr:phospho-N-acetylmuramoyl-pentapeptide-transferase [Clostridia bacterium]
MSEYYIVIAACLSFAVTALSGFVLIPLLRRLRFGQSIREDGPTWHEKKQGTPTMGGIMFILGIGAAIPFALSKAGDSGEKYGIIYCGLTALLFGLVGFIDDFIKVSKKQNLGVTVKQKLFLQFAAAIAFTVSMGVSGLLSSQIDIPFTKWSIDIG